MDAYKMFAVYLIQEITNDLNEYHCDDGPAVVYSDGSKEWYQHGKLHRNNGPAVESPNDDRLWFVNGVNFTSEIELWLKENDISYPFSKDNLIEFQLRWL